MDPGWVRALSPVASDLERVVAALAERSASGERYLPPADAVLRAFQEPFDHVRVLIVGQDPYPTPGHSIGLAFAVEPHVRPLPRSLKNIYRELADDLGVEMPLHGDLRHWAEQGVLLLNRVLTVKAGVAGSHHGLGWEAITARAITALVERGGPLVAILWGRHAQKLQPLLGDVPVIASAHPSPLSARNGFFGSRPFSRANALLAQQGAAPVEWTIPAQD
ncbi:uracil-DNA glycosylase [Ruicaihuangia caeni]|uniref:uracil-DNA glycosylase n=1 Tax=Ruicaihuangia caeni TaxID=3042517 RepID=UPI00338E121D